MIRVIHLGLGEIGKGTIEGLLAQGRDVKLVGIVDIHPSFSGKTLREVLKRRDVPPLSVSQSLAQTLKHARADVATMTTGSRTEQVRPTLEELIDAGVHVVSTCEELAFPQLRAAKIAAENHRH